MLNMIIYKADLCLRAEFLHNAIYAPCLMLGKELMPFFRKSESVCHCESYSAPGQTGSACNITYTLKISVTFVRSTFLGCKWAISYSFNCQFPLKFSEILFSRPCSSLYSPTVFLFLSPVVAACLRMT